MIQKFIDSIYSLAISTISNQNGVGGTDDPGKSFSINRVKPVNDYEIAALYFSSGLIQKIVDLIPSLCETVEIVVNSKSNSEIVNQLKEDLLDKKFLNIFCNASISARLFRESYILLDVDDNTSYDQPINWENCQGLSDVYLLEFGALTPIWNLNSTTRIQYKLSLSEYKDDKLPFENSQIIHSDRVLLFTGKYLTPKLEQLNLGRHASILDGIVEQYGTMQNSFNNSASILSRVLTFLYKMKGLLNQLDLGNENSIIKRLRLAKRNIGALGGILLDLDTEEIEPMQVSLAGIPETLKAHKELFTAQTELTHDQLWNEGSIDTKSELEDKNFQRIILNFLRNNWQDHWQKLCKVFACRYTQDLTDLTFKLALPDPETNLKEELETKYLQAQIDQIYSNLEVLTREIIQGNRFTSSPYETDLNLQSSEGLQELDKRKAERQKQQQKNKGNFKDSKFTDAIFSSPEEYQLTNEDVQKIVADVANINPILFEFINADVESD